MQSHTVPAATWAVFRAEGEMPDSVQGVYREFYKEWLPNSGYGLADVPVIECYFPDRQEIWIGIVKPE